MPEHQSDRAKIRILMKSIQKSSWFLPAATKVDSLTDFSAVTQAISRMPTKISYNEPSFVRAGAQVVEDNAGCLYGDASSSDDNDATSDFSNYDIADDGLH